MPLLEPWYHIFSASGMAYVGANFYDWTLQQRLNYKRHLRYRQKAQELKDQSTEELDVSWKRRAIA